MLCGAGRQCAALASELAASKQQAAKLVAQLATAGQAEQRVEEEREERAAVELAALAAELDRTRRSGAESLRVTIEAYEHQLEEAHANNMKEKNSDIKKQVSSAWY